MFQHNLQRLREGGGYTQATFAKALKVSLRTVQNWEQGHREPALEMVGKIARALGVSADALLDASQGRADKPAARKAADGVKPAPKKSKGRGKRG